MPKVQEDVEIRISDQKQPKEYITTLTLDSNGKAIHITDLIQGILHHLVFRTKAEGELSILVTPENIPEWNILKLDSFVKFAVYSPRLVSVDVTGEMIKAPPEWDKIFLSDRLSITITGGQEGSQIDLIIKYS